MTTQLIKVKELAKKIIANEKVFILDVRNTEDFNDWKIEGKNVEILNTPYFDLLDGVDIIADSLPKNQPIYVVCAKGGSSEFVADELIEAGFVKSYSVEGGMKAWSEHLEPIQIGTLKNGGYIHQFVRMGKGCLSYVIESNGEAVIIDAARMTDIYDEFLSERNLKLVHVADTHLHADHISGGRVIAEKHKASYWLPPKDAEEVTFEYQHLVENKELLVGNTKILIQPIYTPGHTIGSTSFIIDDQYLLSGDILFIDSIGRPDLAGKAQDWVTDLRNSLYNRYKELSDDLLVLPAHYMGINETNADGSVHETLRTLFKVNHGLNIENEEEFRKLVSENLPPQPNSYQEIREVNMGKISPSLEEQREMEIGPNRCAVR